MADRSHKKTLVLQVNKLYAPWTGGVETVVRDIAEILKSSDDFGVTILTCVPKGKAKEDEVDGVRVVRSASWGMLFGMPISFDFLFKFRRLAKKSDVLLLHHPFPLGFLAHFFFSRRKRVVVWYHSDIVRQKLWGFILLPLIQAVLKKAEKIFVSSRNIKVFSRPLSKYQNKCVVVPFGIDTEQYVLDKKAKASAEEIRNRYGDPLVLGVGRLVYYKGFEDLIRAIERVPEAKLLIIGRGPLENKLSKLIKSEGLSERVHLLGRADDLVPYYHACDLFVLPSVARSEAFGMVQLEAMACGKPVVNTDLPTGVPEVSLDGVTGLTVPPGDAERLAGAIGQLLKGKGLRERLGAAGEKRAKEHFSKENFAQLLLQSLGR